MFYIARSYSRPVAIEAEDLLTAVKYAANYEADLYEGNYLIFSPLGFSQEENEKRLLECGITTYVTNNRLCYKYTDESKNTKKYFAVFSEYEWDEKPHLQVHIHDYKSSKDEVMFESIEAVYQEIKEKYQQFSQEAITIGLFDDNGYTSLKVA